jgi:hypothetical protein
MSVMNIHSAMKIYRPARAWNGWRDRTAATREAVDKFEYCRGYKFATYVT